MSLTDIQGDILLDGLPKIAELFCFFKILDPEKFRQRLPGFTDKWIATVQMQQKERKDIDDFKNKNASSVTGKDSALVNIAFSRLGLSKLQKDTNNPLVDVMEQHFKDGMQRDALQLKDPAKKDDRNATIATQEAYIPDWQTDFIGTDREIVMDGVILIAGNTPDVIRARLAEMTESETAPALKGAIKITKTILGKQRTKVGEEKNEHFGFLDGVSEPWVENVDGTSPDPARHSVPLSTIVSTKNDWTNNGSYMVFRYLVQKVPEFKAFCEKQATEFQIQSINVAANDVRSLRSKTGATTITGGEVLAARMVGRWPTGIPITDTALNSSSKALVKIDFANSGCPFAAHIRKTAPRDSRQGQFVIMRRGIQFGDEVRAGEETKSDFLKDFYLDYSKESNFRGLLFACYQSDISNGFFFIQNQWANNVAFPDRDGNAVSTTSKGIDPIIGQVNPLRGRDAEGGACSIAGMKDPSSTGKNVLSKMPFVNELVLPAGGEYFFSPSIKALKKNLATGSGKVT